MKDDHFGQESKIGLYRVASKGRISISGASRWVNLNNCDEICKNMIKKMRLNDANHLALTVKTGSIADKTYSWAGRKI